VTPNAAPSNAAPPNLAQFLAESVSGPGGDALADRESAVTWLRSAALLADDAEITNSEHAALLRLRDALRDVRSARATGRQDPEAAARLSRTLADGRLVVTVTPAGGARLVSSARAPYSSVVAAIAIAVAESGV
jgi:hypothetical protein